MPAGIKVSTPGAMSTDCSAGSSNRETVATLYGIERAAGNAVQANLLAVWVASSTYGTAAFGVFLIFFSNLNTDRLDSVANPVALLSVLPFPACALACYHAILFGIGSIHSKSIELLEEELICYASQEMRGAYAQNRLASKAETHWSTFDKRNKELAFAQIVAFLVPLSSAIFMSIVCMVRIGKETDHSAIGLIFLSALYLVSLVFAVILSVRTLRGLKATSK